MVSKWYETHKKGGLTDSKMFVESPKEGDMVRQLNISSILGKNNEDHFHRMNSQIQEFENIRKQIDPISMDGANDFVENEKSDQKK